MTDDRPRYGERLEGGVPSADVSTSGQATAQPAADVSADAMDADAVSTPPAELSRLGQALQVGIPIMSGLLALLFVVQLFIEGPGPASGNVFFLLVLVVICIVSTVWWRRDVAARAEHAAVHARRDDAEAESEGADDLDR